MPPEGIDLYHCPISQDATEKVWLFEHKLTDEKRERFIWNNDLEAWELLYSSCTKIGTQCVGIPACELSKYILKKIDGVWRKGFKVEE